MGFVEKPYQLNFGNSRVIEMKKKKKSKKKNKKNKTKKKKRKQTKKTELPKRLMTECLTFNKVYHFL